MEHMATRKEPLRIGLIGEGTYPVTKGGVGTWYEQLVEGLTDHEFAVVTLVGNERDLRWNLPKNVTSLTLAPMWDPPPRAPFSGRRSESRRIRHLLLDLWRAALPANQAQGPNTQDAIRILRELSMNGTHSLASTLSRSSSVEAITTAWAEYRFAHPALPPMMLSEASQVAQLADRILAVLDLEWPEVDLTHASTNGPSSLIGLARLWRDGTPFILTEHGVYLRERYLALYDMNLPWTTRAALGGILRLISSVAYAEAEVLAPVSEFNARWERELGAEDTRVAPLHNGVDVDAYSPISTEPSEPTVSFVGRIDPLKDLHTLIEAFTMVRFSIPKAKLRIFGPVPEQNQAYYESLLELVKQRKLESAVCFEGPSPNARIAAEAGHVVALSSISEGLPFTVIEAMMCGRATVSTDVGGVSEVVGTDGLSGIVVPPRDPLAFASALIELLNDDHLRARMGLHARERALQKFSLSKFYDNVRGLYTKTVMARSATRSAGTESVRTTVFDEIVGGQGTHVDQTGAPREASPTHREVRKASRPQYVRNRKFQS